MQSMSCGDCSAEQVSVLLHMANSLETEADINPLPKVDRSVQYSDFRGINMTPVIGSCFERTVYHHYSKKVFEGNLTVTQYAYREGCSFTDALN